MVRAHWCVTLKIIPRCCYDIKLTIRTEIRWLAKYIDLKRPTATSVIV